MRKYIRKYQHFKKKKNMEKLIKGIKIASKIAEVILAISVIGDVVEKYGGKIKSTKVEADVSKEEASETKE